jgi:hypothetical protein
LNARWPDSRVEAPRLGGFRTFSGNAERAVWQAALGLVLPCESIALLGFALRGLENDNLSVESAAPGEVIGGGDRRERSTE